VCTAIALAWSEPPLAVIEEYGLDRLTHDRGGEKEIRFYRASSPGLLPVWFEGRLRVVRWGCKDRSDRRLPPTGWTWRTSVEAGRWAHLRPEPVVIPATYALSGGVWFRVKQGMHGLVVRDRWDELAAFMVVERATRYFQVMCRSEWMPVLVGEVI
jgi:hypothetical protein